MNLNVVCLKVVKNMSKFTAEELVEFYQKVADGSCAEVSHEGKQWDTAFGGPNLYSNKENWRIKPAQKIIDISHFIKSGIDCEFSDSEVFLQIGKLTGIQNGEFCKDNYQGFNYCRPRMNHKMYHDGGECPLPEGFRVKFYFRDGESLTNVKYKNARWYLCQEGRDIIGYEVLGLADGWAYPWECEE